MDFWYFTTVAIVLAMVRDSVEPVTVQYTNNTTVRSVPRGDECPFESMFSSRYGLGLR